MIDVNFVISIHDEILNDLGGLPGFGGGGRGAVESALQRVQNRIDFQGLNDVLGIAASYAEVLARGHLFNDGNKRTGLTCALSYLEEQGIHVPKEWMLEEATVMLAEGSWDYDGFAWLLGLLADLDASTITS